MLPIDGCEMLRQNQRNVLCQLNCLHSTCLPIQFFTNILRQSTLIIRSTPGRFSPPNPFGVPNHDAIFHAAISVCGWMMWGGGFGLCRHIDTETRVRDDGCIELNSSCGKICVCVCVRERSNAIVK